MIAIRVRNSVIICNTLWSVTSFFLAWIHTTLFGKLSISVANALEKIETQKETCYNLLYTINYYYVKNTRHGFSTSIEFLPSCFLVVQDLA